MKHRAVVLLALAILQVTARKQSRDAGAEQHDVVGRISSERNQLDGGGGGAGGGGGGGGGRGVNDRQGSRRNGIENDGGSGAEEQFLDCMEKAGLALLDALKAIHEALRREGAGRPGGLTPEQLAALLDCLERNNISPMDAVRALEDIVHNLNVNSLTTGPSNRAGDAGNTNPSQSGQTTTNSRGTPTGAGAAAPSEDRGRSVANLIHQEQNQGADSSKKGSSSKY